VQRAHVGEVDYLRVIGLVSIVLIHSFGFYLSMPVSGPGARIFQELVVDLLRFGRYIFMFVTGAVLFYSYSGRQLCVKSFFGRRLKSLVIPYIVWTAIYLWIQYWAKMVSWPNAGAFLVSWAKNLLNGGAYSHLYYIIVSIQFYLLFPVLLALFRPARRRLATGILLAGGLALYGIYFFLLEAHASQVAAMAAGTPWAGIVNLFVAYKDRIIVSYLPFYLVGGLVGLNLDTGKKWLAGHGLLINIGLIATGGLMVGEYFYLYRHLGQSWYLTVSVFNPAMYVYSWAVILILFRLALTWEKRRSLRPLVSLLAANSLGIYLIHPAVLYVIHSYFWPVGYVPGTLLVILDPAAAVAISCLISYLLARSRYTRFIIGEAGNLSRRLGAPPRPRPVAEQRESVPRLSGKVRSGVMG